MIIYCNTPKTIDLDESQGFSFYDRNVKIMSVFFVAIQKESASTRHFLLLKCGLTDQAFLTVPPVARIILTASKE